MNTRITIETPPETAADVGGWSIGSSLHDKLVHQLRTVMDPELPVNIYDLGLIYNLDISPTNEVNIRMTLTAPNCPVAGEFPAMVQEAVMKVPGITGCKVQLVFDPPWDKSKLSEAVKLELGLL